MKNPLWVLFLAALVACTANAPISPDRGKFTPARLDPVERLLKEEIAAKRMPGAVVQVWHRGTLVRTLVAGQLDPQAATPMREDAIFRIYSMTKPIVSVAAMILVEEGKIALAAPVSSYIPELKELKVAEASPAAEVKPEPALVKAKRQPTVHDLLRHTAGFTSAGEDAPVKRLYEKAGMDMDVIAPDAFVKALASLPLAYHPGTTWEYGVSTDVLGLLIERVSRMPLEKFLDERIFVPLRMVDTAFEVGEAKQPRVAQPFLKYPNGQDVKVWDVRKPRNFKNAGGALTSTAGDYMRFARMMMNGGELDGARIISRKSVEFITSDHLNGVTGPNYFFGEGYGFGLGVAVRMHAGVAHSLGSVGDYFWVGYGGTIFWVDPREQLIVVMMTQAPGLQWRNLRTHRNLIYSLME